MFRMAFESKRRCFAWVRWGLIPPWAKTMDKSYAPINARSETVAYKPLFRDAFRRRRCLIPADGFYEWQENTDSKAKQPWFIALRSRLPMALAGLWERWRSPEGEDSESCSVIVTDANELVRPIRNTMTVILAPGHWNAWLGSTPKDFHALQILLKPYPSSDMEAWPVSRMVNNPNNDSAACIEF